MPFLLGRGFNHSLSLTFHRKEAAGALQRGDKELRIVRKEKLHL